MKHGIELDGDLSRRVIAADCLEQVQDDVTVSIVDVVETLDYEQMTHVYKAAGLPVYTRDDIDDVYAGMPATSILDLTVSDKYSRGVVECGWEYSGNKAYTVVGTFERCVHEHRSEFDYVVAEAVSKGLRVTPTGRVRFDAPVWMLAAVDRADRHFEHYIMDVIHESVEEAEEDRQV